MRAISPSFLFSLVLVAMSCVSSRTAFSQDSTATVPDTLCYSIEEVRQMLGGIALGQAGFERLELELRAHARTYARLKMSRANEADLKRALLKLRESVDRYQEAYEKEQSAAEDYRMLYQEEQRKRNRDTRIGVVLLIALLTALILS